MKIVRAAHDDIDDLAEHVWLDTQGDRPTQQALESFTGELAN